MPWTTGDVDRFKKGLSDKEKRQWVAIANDVLARCLADGGDRDECERKAIMQASGKVAEQEPGGPEMCECPECDYEQEKERGEPCRSVKCPECGAMLVAQVEQEAEDMPDELDEVMKTVDGKQYPAGDFLVVEDRDKPSTWHLQVKRNGKPDHGLMGGAWAALTAPGGHRGNRYEGPGKAEAIRKLKALYKSEDMETPSAEAEPLDLANLRELLAQALALVDGKLAEQEPEDDGLTEIELAESASGYAIGLAEAQLPLDGNRAPVEFDLKIIAPGAGNKHDNHWYPAEMLQRDAHVFEGVDMFVTDHRENERSERTKVGKIKNIIGFTEDGGPIGRAVIYDPELAEKTRNRATAGELATLHCSILARGDARDGKVDGKKYKIVEAITRADAVDLVSRAGAGGRALSLAESHDGGESMEQEQTTIEEQEPNEEPLEEVTLQEQQTPEETPAPAMLEPEKVREMVEATSLPDAAKAKLSEADYADGEAVTSAIAAEVAYIKEVTGSGKPFAAGAGSAPERKPRTAEEADADWNRILTEVGMPYLAVGGKNA